MEWYGNKFKHERGKMDYKSNNDLTMFNKIKLPSITGEL